MASNTDSELTIINTMLMRKDDNICAIGATIHAARQLCGCTVTDFCREAGISTKSYYRLMHKKRRNR